MTDLTDLQICKKIAEIEGERWCGENGYALVEYGSISKKYNPLTDDALCFQLMVKYKVWRWSNPYCGQFNVCIKGVQGWVTAVTFNKAILLAIIEANNHD